MLRDARARDSAFEGRRILVVEDDVRNIFALSSILEPLGGSVVIARNGREALNRLASKPAPDILQAALAQSGVDPARAVFVGDSVWDLLAARRARALGIGVLSGGYGREELERAGAYRVYEDPADLLLHLDEVGVRHPGES